jgi:hypothetical protein
MNNHISEQELISMCQKWQKILRLQDWVIYTEICRARDIPDGVAGHNKIDLLKKKSVIAILDEADHDPNAAWPCDPEKTLVHELLHLHFETNQELSNGQYIALEQGIDILSNVLVEMNRSIDSQSANIR